MRNLFKCLLLGGLWVVSLSPAWAGERIERVTGVGLTRDEAVANGLEEAVRRVEGVAINSDRTVQSQAAQASVTVDGKDHDRLSYSATQSGSTRMKTSGLVSSYEVISENRGSEGQYRLDLRVRLNTYDTPGFSPHNRRKLAVMPLRCDHKMFEIDGQPISGERLSKRLTHHLVNDLTQTRRFSVMDRMYASEYVQERNYITGADTPLTELIKVGQALGADYLVVGRVVDAGGEHESKRLISGEVIDSGQAYVRVDYRVIVMATRQVKWAATVDINEPIVMVDAASFIESMSEAAAARIRQEMLENIYPTVVAAVTPSGELVLNQGGNGYQVGQKLVVYRQGDIVHDKYTGESLGRTEFEVGQIEILRVLAKTTYARLVNGGTAKVGDLCRTPTDTITRSVEPLPIQADVHKSSGGGVLLPFDRR